VGAIRGNSSQVCSLFRYLCQRCHEDLSHTDLDIETQRVSGAASEQRDFNSPQETWLTEGSVYRNKHIERGWAVYAQTAFYHWHPRDKQSYHTSGSIISGLCQLYIRLFTYKHQGRYDRHSVYLGIALQGYIQSS